MPGCSIMNGLVFFILYLLFYTSDYHKAMLQAHVGIVKQYGLMLVG